MAPEVIKVDEKGYGKPADWWSLGIFMFDCMTGKSPFYSSRGKSVIKQRIMKGNIHYPSYLSFGKILDITLYKVKG